MPYANPEKRKQYLAEWRIKNSDKIKGYENSEKTKQYRIKWKQSQSGYKSRTYSNWKAYGLKDNFDEVWEIYKSTDECMICDKKFTNTKDKSMNHCHETGYYLNVICMKCNILEHNDTYWTCSDVGSSQDK